MARVWGERPDESELEWFYERNPVRPASVLLGEEDGRVVGDGRDQLPAHGDRRRGARGRACRCASRPTPGYRGRGIFARARRRANEERVRELGRPAAADRAERRVGARSSPGASAGSALPPLRVWARAAVLPAGACGSGSSASSTPLLADGRPRAPRRRLARTGASPTRRAATRCSRGDGYAVGATAGGSAWSRRSRAACSAMRRAPRGGTVVIAAPPPWERRRYLARRLPADAEDLHACSASRSTGRPLPERPHFELGDLDFL